MSQQLERVEAGLAREAAVAELAALDPVEYGQRRKEAAKQLGVTAKDIDQAVRRAKRAKPESQQLFPNIEPCAETVDGGALLEEIAEEIRRYIVLPEHAATAAALWVLHTHAVEAAYIAPILAIVSPQKRCGKSNLMTILRALVHRGLLVSNVTLAALYRAMDEFRPTLLIDEADAFLDENEELRGIINAGHSRATAKTLRVGGENRNELEVFDSFGPKAIAGIGERRDTIVDRSIVIPLRRRTKDEYVEVLRQDRLDYGELVSRCAGWAEQNMARLKASNPIVPTELHDRAADNWRSLIAIADLCGWDTKARAAARALTERDADESAAAMLLEDLRALFEAGGTGRLTSAEIVDALVRIEERPWPEWKQGRPITQRQLARLLAAFGIKPKLLKFPSGPARGYEAEQFSDSFARYISPRDPLLRYPSSDGAGSSVSETVTARKPITDRSVVEPEPVTVQNTLEARNDAEGNGVTDQGPNREPVAVGRSCPACAGSGFVHDRPCDTCGEHKRADGTPLCA